MRLANYTHYFFHGAIHALKNRAISDPDYTVLFKNGTSTVQNWFSFVTESNHSGWQSKISSVSEC